MEDKTQQLQSVLPKAIGLASLVPKLVRLMFALFGDKRVPAYLKILTAGAVTYVALPIDVLPDFVPTTGALDDVLVILLLLVQYAKVCPADVFNEHWDAIMGDGFDVEEEVKRSMRALEPVVGDRFSSIRNWIEDAAEKVGQKRRLDAATPADAENMVESE